MKNAVTKATNIKLAQSQAMVYIILIAVLLIAQIASPGYLALTHVAGILRLSSFLGIAAIGQTFAIMIGGIDLSIANVITFSNVIAAEIMAGSDGNMFTALLAVLAMGAVVGTINALGIRFLRIPAFIMTLGVGTIIRGILLIYTNGAPKGYAAPLLRSICGQSMMGIVSGIVIIWLLLSAAIVMIQKITPYGRRIFAIGINERASRYSGIPTGRIMFSVYILSAVFTALAGYFLVGYTGTSFLDVGSEYNTTTIASVVIGGTAITGGKGGYIGTFAGAIMITVLNDFLTIVNIPTAGRQIAQGLIILALVLIYSRGKKHNQ